MDADLATGITSSKLTGALPAISGASLTSLTAANIAAGSLLNTVIASSIAVQSITSEDQILDGAIVDADIANVGMSKITQVPLTTAVAYTVTSTDTVVFADTSAGAFNVTLPAASASTIGKVYYIYNLGGVNQVTVVPNGDTINGTTVTTGTYRCIRVIGLTSTSWIGTEMI